MIKECASEPDVLRMYLAINPNYPDDIRSDLADYDKFKPWVFGLKFLPDYHKTVATDAKYRYALDFANERGLPVLIHTWGGSVFDGGNGAAAGDVLRHGAAEIGKEHGKQSFFHGSIPFRIIYVSSLKLIISHLFLFVNISQCKFIKEIMFFKKIFASLLLGAAVVY